eukprot:4402509-Lingulodinium_polyedra.AAC.1
MPRALRHHGIVRKHTLLTRQACDGVIQPVFKTATKTFAQHQYSMSMQSAPEAQRPQTRSHAM